MVCPVSPPPSLISASAYLRKGSAAPREELVVLGRVVLPAVMRRDGGRLEVVLEALGISIGRLNSMQSSLSPIPEPIALSLSSQAGTRRRVANAGGKCICPLRFSPAHQLGPRRPRHPTLTPSCCRHRVQCPLRRLTLTMLPPLLAVSSRYAVSLAQIVASMLAWCQLSKGLVELVGGGKNCPSLPCVAQNDGS